MDTSRFEAVGVLLANSRASDAAALDAFLDFSRHAREQGASKAEYVAAFRALLGEFDHVETGRNLDEQM